jgi:DegV family protein with EDD domain
MIQLIVDSTSDMSREDQERYKIEVVPLTLHFGGQSYLDGIDITNEQFVELLSRSKILPKTSQVNPQQFYQAFRPHLEAGHEVIGMFIASPISGTYQSACMAKEMLAADQVPVDRLFLIDTLSATMSHTLLACEAAKYRDAGHEAEDIVGFVTALTLKVRFLAIVDTLKYLHLGGRISLSTAMMGKLLGIKPLVTITDGNISQLGAARGLTGAFKKLLQEIEKDPPDLNYGIALAHANAPDLINKATAYLQKPLGFQDWVTCSIGSVLGTYSGPNCIGIAYIAQ